MMKMASSSSSSSSSSMMMMMIKTTNVTEETKRRRRHSKMCLLNNDQKQRGRHHHHHRAAAISSSSSNKNNDNGGGEYDYKQFMPMKEGEQNEEVLQSTDEEKMGRAAQYMRELIKRQVRSNDLPRAGSLTDSTVLRRKGRLKEQDALIEFMVEMHKTHTTEEVMLKVEGWIDETLQLPKNVTVHEIAQNGPTGWILFPLVTADESVERVRRVFAFDKETVRFAELCGDQTYFEHSAGASHGEGREAGYFKGLDGTLYQDGKHFEDDNKMIDKIIQLMELGIHVAIVTAAGYPGQPEKFEERTRGLLDQFKKQKLPPNITKYFHVMGGECNYLLNVNETYGLQFVPNEEWATVEQVDGEKGRICKLFWTERRFS